jgi:hypothetical protein
VNRDSENNLKSSHRVLFCLILPITFTIIGCKSIKSKTDKELNTTTRTETYKKADTLVYTVPKTVYKDTTIYVRNFEKSGSNTLKIVYDKEGNQQQIDCISDAVKELNETITNFKDNSKVKETDFKTTSIIYIFLGLAGLLIVNKIANKFI